MTTRGGRLLERLPRLTAFSAAELLLLVLLAVQGARLIWTLLTPLEPVGDWKAASGLTLPPSSGVLAGFDPFFRLSASGPVVVTSLNLILHGVREDRATGRGSAIIALPDGRQMSFAVGEEIMPGVVLTGVGFDNVTISRAGTAEQLFLDQSEPAPTAGGAAGQTPVPGAPQIATPAPQAGLFSGSAMTFQPRIAGGGINGIIVTPGTDGGQAFRAAGFQLGDVIVSVNGQRITSVDQARVAAAGTGGEVNVMVDRGGRAVALRVRLNP
ncbi:MAG TPA: type II secretion system protein N [Allosphingosinicella sp.]|nr:type II secretion system protein N [Allosphingosinicella sp.]